MAYGTGIRVETILRAPDFVQPCVLSSGTAQAYDVPTGMAFVFFSFDNDFWVDYGSTGAVVPAASATASSGSELNPTYRSIMSTAATTGISIVSDYAAKGSIAWYKAG